MADHDLTRTIQATAPPSAANQPRLSGMKTTDILNESTRTLLRSRVIVSAAIILILLSLIKISGLLAGSISVTETPLRMLSPIILAAILGVLLRRADLNLMTLRSLGVIVFALPVSEALMVQVVEIQKLVDSNQVQQIARIYISVNFAIALFMAIYGMLIPSRWQLTAVVTATAAILPSIVMAIQATMTPEIESILPDHFAPILALVMAATATTATFIVRKIRREAEVAKQYGQYQLMNEIGRGGMGVVYKAKHKMLKRPAAIKLIHADVSKQPAVTASFEKEVQMSAALSHWNTVQIYDYGRTDEGEFYYVMEYLEGSTLEQWIRKKKRLSLLETVPIVEQICDGLWEAHQQGMVHRDIKPANVFLARTGGLASVVKILDFGIAIMKSEQKTKVSGSPAFMSPEQISGETVDGRSDIYSIGCLMFQCLTGEFLFTGQSVAEVIQLQLHKAPPLHRLPTSAEPLSEVLAQCLAKKKTDRYESVLDLKRAVLAATQDATQTPHES